jgi:hypothetical protein
MPGKHSISIISKPVGRSQGHAPGVSVQSISLRKTTMIYTHVLNRGGKGVKSPLDELSMKNQGCYMATIRAKGVIEKLYTHC